MVFRSRSTEYGDADSALLRLARSRMLARRLGDPSREAENIFHELHLSILNREKPVRSISCDTFRAFTREIMSFNSINFESHCV